MHDDLVQKTRSRCLGAFVGLAIGDALGAPVEFKKRGTFEAVTSMRSGGFFDLPAGAWTDDTAMALCLADSLLNQPSFDAKDLLDRFCEWIAKGTNTSTGKCIGIGQNTLRTIGNYHSTGQTKAITFGNRSDGNGAIMRLAAIPCMYWSDLERGRKLAVAQSQCTHNSVMSEACCELLTIVLCKLIFGDPWDQIMPWAAVEDWPEGVAFLGQCEWRNKTIDEIQSTGYVIHTLEASLYCVDTTSTFEGALLKAVNLGDDADSVGAVTGQMAGAKYGVDSIPQDWLDKLIDREKIISIGEEIFSKSIDISGEKNKHKKV